MKLYDVHAIRQSLEQNSHLLDAQVELLGVLAHRHRLRIIQILGMVGEIQQSDLLKILGISKANLSQHLTHLRTVGVIVSENIGRTTSHKLRYPAIKDACTMVRDMIRKSASDILGAEVSDS